ncbi:hypothetical protein QVD17_10659 [Tagetes erecta]|uniref:Uncharacterized protein n=1 Tax=Tagetes erecta TaxID=13708 RepID=A0AAD8P4Z8_TARER|nr:hypothetical protein QVD17_10659 [Tagetes erecta]
MRLHQLYSTLNSLSIYSHSKAKLLDLFSPTTQHSHPSISIHHHHHLLFKSTLSTQHSVHSSSRYHTLTLLFTNAAVLYPFHLKPKKTYTHCVSLFFLVNASFWYDEFWRLNQQVDQQWANHLENG